MITYQNRSQLEALGNVDQLCSADLILEVNGFQLDLGNPSTWSSGISALVTIVILD